MGVLYAKILHTGWVYHMVEECKDGKYTSKCGDVTKSKSKLDIHHLSHEYAEQWVKKHRICEKCREASFWRKRRR